MVWPTSIEFDDAASTVVLVAENGGRYRFTLDGEFLDLYATHLKLEGRQGLSAEAFLAELRASTQPG